MSSCPLGEGDVDLPDVSILETVPSAGKRFNTSINTAYDLAMLNRIFGISSSASLSIIGRIDFSMTGMLIAGARV